MSNPQKSVQELDAELSRLLNATLDASTKFELEAQRVLKTLKSLEEESPSSPPEEAATTTEGQEYPTSPAAGNTPADAPAEAHRPQAEVLARVRFEDGDAVHFLAIPADGEIGLAYIGSNQQRMEAISELPSLLRLYVSIAPPEASLPWLLAAVDKQQDRLALVDERHLCDRVDEPLESESGPGGTLRLRVPALRGGFWFPDTHDDDVVDEEAIGGYCGWNGENLWNWNYCQHDLPTGPLGEPDLYQCTAPISTEVTHRSLKGGKWRRRRCVMTRVVACGSSVRVRTQYRKWNALQVKWVWKTSYDEVLSQTQIPKGGPLVGCGLVRRRRQNIFERQGSIGGFRAWSRFSRNLFYSWPTG